MIEPEKKEKKEPRDHKPPTVGTNLKWEGRELPMFLHRGEWRIRSRSKSFQVDISTGTTSLTEAKKIAREKLANLPVKEKRSVISLETVAGLYLGAPKRCGEDAAQGNVSRLRSVVRAAWGKTLEDVRVSSLPDLWPAYVAARQGLPGPNYATRRRESYGINSAMRQAASVFIPALRPFYKRQGVELPADAINIIWCAESSMTPAAAEDEKLREAWAGLRGTDIDMWLAVGLARFAGLRQAEIEAMRGKWLIQKGAATYVELRDREEDKYWTKTGKAYHALLLSPDLAEYITALPPESRVIGRPDAARWIQRKPQAWLKAFTGTAKAPLHRLRGLYADHVKRETEEAILARAEAVREASRNLGHTSTATTEGHYLTPDGH